MLRSQGSLSIRLVCFLLLVVYPFGSDRLFLLGISVCPPSTMIPILCQVVAQSTDDSVDDSNSRVRETILNIFLEIHNYIGKDIWKLIGDYKEASELLATKLSKPIEQKRKEL
jgi:hypothetical protein